MEMSSRRELDLFLVINGINSEDPYRFFTWKVTYGDIYLMGVKKQFLDDWLVYDYWKNCTVTLRYVHRFAGISVLPVQKNHLADLPVIYKLLFWTVPYLEVVKFNVLAKIDHYQIKTV